MRHIRYLFAILCLSIYLLMPAPTEAETLRFTTIDYCPFTCDPDKEDGKEGFMTDVLRAALEEAGHSIEVKIYPYARALAAVKLGEFDGIVVTLKELAPELIYTESPTEKQRVAFLARKGINWNYTGIDSLAEVSIAVVKGYDYSDPDLNQYIKEYESTDKVIVLHGINTTERAIKMLLTDRIDAYVDGEYSILYNLIKLGAGDNISVAGYTPTGVEDYTAFTPHNPKSIEYAKLLTDKIRQLRQSGELNQILKSYGIDPKP